MGNTSRRQRDTLDWAGLANLYGGRIMEKAGLRGGRGSSSNPSSNRLLIDLLYHHLPMKTLDSTRKLPAKTRRAGRKRRSVLLGVGKKNPLSPLQLYPIGRPSRSKKKSGQKFRKKFPGKGQKTVCAIFTNLLASLLSRSADQEKSAKRKEFAIKRALYWLILACSMVAFNWE